MRSKSFLVFGATGRTGRHFVSLALSEGHRVKALVRNPGQRLLPHDNLHIVQGSITAHDDVDDLVEGTDCVIMMLGDARSQARAPINARFVAQLIPAMRRHAVKRLLYQAGALTRPYGGRLPLIPWILRKTVARFGGLEGQHQDNESVINYLVEEGADIDWIVHRAAIIGEGPSKGILQRSKTRPGLATFGDCATYNYRLLADESAIHTYDLSCYQG